MNDSNSNRLAITKFVPALLIVLASCGGSPRDSGPPESVKFPDDLKNQAVAVSGIYPDGWAGDTISLDLRQASGRNLLGIRGVVPRIDDAGFRTEIDVAVDRHTVLRQSVGLGDFQLLAPVPDGAGKRQVQVRFSAVQRLPGTDGRSIGARLTSIGFESSGPNEAAPSDIVRGAGIALGGHWGDRETFHNETFRWVDNDAEILLTPNSSGDQQVTLQLQPGPGVDGPFLLQALDEAGRRIDAVRVTRRESVALFLPAQAGQPNRFRLHIDGGGKRTPNDARVLNFRVFRIAAQPWQTVDK